MPKSERVFLSAEWRELVMLNYEVDPGLLSRYVPRGTSLDTFEGKTYVSLVGFRFLRTKIFGRITVPFHVNFEEVNLRFYVRRKEGNEDRRGVVFIAEIVPRRAIALTARFLYGENYLSLPMQHKVKTKGSSNTFEYHWRTGGQWCRLSAQTDGVPAQPHAASLEQFITEHYWGYSVQGKGGCVEYRVTHLPWNVWPASAAAFEGDAASLYGSELASVLRCVPDSAFVAEGSSVTVFKGNPIL
jgi:uncharacterized protein